MQTILGANGQIGEGLARALKENYTSEIKIVGRNPQSINDTDTLFVADLMDKQKAMEALKDTEIAYFTLGLPMNTELWQAQFIPILQNVIDACKANCSKLVFFDNTYMYPQNDSVLTEATSFAPVGPKGKVRATMAEMILKEIKDGTLEAVICRAPEFYGPEKTQSITNTFIFQAIEKHKTLKVPICENKLRSLIWTPDASKATALIGNTPNAFGQTWHLPIDENRLTYKQIIELCEEIYEEKLDYIVIPKIGFTAGKLFSDKVKEMQELLPRYEYNNIFDVSKFKNRFPEFKITSYKEGIRMIKEEQKM